MTEIMTEKDKLEFSTMGYSIYCRRISEGVYPEATLKLIEKKREELLAKYKNIQDKKLHCIIGLVYSKNFLAPIDYPGVFVDWEDVFAISYIYDVKPGFIKSRNENFIMWLIFTNNEHIPIIPAIYLQKNKLLDDILKRKRNDLVPIFAELGINLKYPIQELEEFEQLLEKERTIKGKLSKHFIRGQIYDAKGLSGLFDPCTISCEMSELSRDILYKYGYVTDA